jgi:hypothetical protein
MRLFQVLSRARHNLILILEPIRELNRTSIRVLTVTSLNKLMGSTLGNGLSEPLTGKKIPRACASHDSPLFSTVSKELLAVACQLQAL